MTTDCTKMYIRVKGGGFKCSTAFSLFFIFPQYFKTIYHFLSNSQLCYTLCCFFTVGGWNMCEIWRGVHTFARRNMKRSSRNMLGGFMTVLFCWCTNSQMPLTGCCNVHKWHLLCSDFPTRAIISNHLCPPVCQQWSGYYHHHHHCCCCCWWKWRYTKAGQQICTFLLHL